VFLLLEDSDIGPLRFQQKRNNIGPGSVECNTRGVKRTVCRWQIIVIRSSDIEKEDTAQASI
jgi:hypothetical protein